MAVSRGIMALTERSSEFSEHDVEMAVRIVTELLILSIDARQRGVIKNTLSAMSNMFNVPKKSLVGAERKYQSAKGYVISYHFMHLIWSAQIRQKTEFELKFNSKAHYYRNMGGKIYLAIGAKNRIFPAVETKGKR